MNVKPLRWAKSDWAKREKQLLYDGKTRCGTVVCTVYGIPACRGIRATMHVGMTERRHRDGFKSLADAKAWCQLRWQVIVCSWVD